MNYLCLLFSYSFTIKVDLRDLPLTSTISWHNDINISEAALIFLELNADWHN